MMRSAICQDAAHAAMPLLLRLRHALLMLITSFTAADAAADAVD